MEAATSRHAHLRVVTEDGELLDGCPACAEHEDTIAGLERTIRSQAGTIARLSRNRRAEAEAHADWPVVEQLFVVWQKLAGKPRCAFDWKRFELAQPFLSKDGYEVCLQAIVGRTFDCYVTKRKNGTSKAFNEWERIFADRGEFEDSANRRPDDWRDRVLAVGERTTSA